MSGTAPSGYYPDPRDPNKMRYWDGNARVDEGVPRIIAGAIDVNNVVLEQ